MDLDADAKWVCTYGSIDPILFLDTGDGAFSFSLGLHCAHAPLDYLNRAMVRHQFWWEWLGGWGD